MHDVDQRVAQLARRQFGLFTRRQFLEFGSPRQAERRLKDRWEIVEPGLYRLPGHPSTWESRLMAACLLGDGVVSHRSAGVLWGLDGLRRGRPEITVGRSVRLRRNWVRVHQSTQFDRRLDLATRNGLRVTGIGRTVLDLAAVVGYETTLHAIDDARRRRLLTWPGLYSVLVQHSRRGRNGAGRLRALLVQHFGEPEVADSAFERMVEQLLLANGLAAPRIQHEVVDGDFRARLDLAYPWAKVGIELDGRHHLSDAAFESDPVRRNRLSVLGWTILNFTWRFYADRPLELVRIVGQALDASKLRRLGHGSVV